MDTIDEIFNLYVKYGNKNYIGEEVSQLEHGYQAALQAEKNGYNKSVIVGAFLHDIGHLLEFENPDLKTMGNLGIMNHEKIGAEYLRSHGFPEITCSIVENHVNTKRYLISKNNDYFNNLSNASKQTFNYQGGKMSLDEQKNFENGEFFEIHLKMRSFDDLAKDVNMKIDNNDKIINKYKNMSIEILQRS